MSPIVKRKREKFTLPSSYLVLILSFLCIGMTVLTFSTDLFSGPLGTIAGYVIVPFQNGITEVGSFLSDRSDELAQLRDVQRENEALRQQVDELTIENTLLQQDKYELNNLRELYKLDAQYEQYEKVGARIIAWDGGNWFNSFTIDKGTEDGIQVDMNVMAGSGLVGRVTDVGPNWAKVMSIIDDNSNVSGSMLSTSDKLIVSGDLELMSEGVIRFKNLIDSDDKVVEGDKIVTSSVSDKYLPGILIGYISSIGRDSNNLTKSGTMTPAVDFAHLEEVLVILELKQQVE
ncbi:MAG: rod shape-determining protein MreC [Clostridiales bacterium]|nr:rod shape-determining protein MreC [Clostridiales bacterium]